MEPTPPTSGWHLKREIQLGHILTTIVVAASAAVYVNQIDKRITSLEVHQQRQLQRDEDQDAALLRTLASIDKRLDRLDDKLDSLLTNGKTKP